MVKENGTKFEQLWMKVVRDWGLNFWKSLSSSNQVDHTRYESLIFVAHTSGKEIVQVHFLFDGYQAGNLGDWIVPWGVVIFPPHTAARNTKIGYENLFLDSSLPSFLFF